MKKKLIKKDKLKTQILTIIGTRPEIIKMSQMIPMLDKNFDHQFIFTSQHYSTSMVEIFFNELNIRTPDKFLGINLSEYYSMIKPIQLEIKRLNPDYVMVYGDTNSTLSASIVAKSMGIKVIHVEAGLRSFDRKMPEELNRVLTDQISDYLFTPTRLTKGFLEKEKIIDNVFVVGNTVVDACLKYSEIAEKKSNIIKEVGVKNGNYILVTAHRQENVDNPENLLKILNILSDLPLKVVFPVHPRTKKRIIANNYKTPENIIEIEPLGYLDFLKLMKHSFLIITDSGGIQEEAVTLKIPCLTIRDSTERWETLIEGGNFLVGTNPELVGYYVKMILESELKEKMRKTKNPYGEGNASKNIVEFLKNKLVF